MMPTKYQESTIFSVLESFELPTLSEYVPLAWSTRYNSSSLISLGVMGVYVHEQGT